MQKCILPFRADLVNASLYVIRFFLDLFRKIAYNVRDCTQASPEVTDINKQRFLAELAQLLTFMYEEDRQDALMVYSGMFDEATDEQALIQSLVSPIRQAVLVARAYNATERKLQTRSQSRAEVGAERDESVAPDYLQAIFAIRAEAMQKQNAVVKAAEEDKNQFSLFDQAAQEQAEAQPVLAPDRAEAPAGAEDGEDAAGDAAPAEEPADEAPDEAPLPDDPEERVDAFMASYDAPVEEPAAEEKKSVEELLSEAEKDPEDRFVEIAVGDGSPAVERTVRKPRVLLLLLYVLLAIPVTLVGIVLLLIPTLLCLGAAAACISVGVLAVSSVFGGFAVLADLLVVLGAALILLALGLLFLWLFIWMVGGAIGGLVRGVCALARKWCYKEVPAI